MESVILCRRNINLKVNVFEFRKTFKNLRTRHFFVGCRKDFARDISFFKTFKRFEQNLQPAVSYKCHTDFELRAVIQIFNKFIVKTADRPICNKVRFFHNAAGAVILRQKRVQKIVRFLGQMCFLYLTFLILKPMLDLE